LRQLRARPAGKRPDLALGREDVTLTADRRSVTVRVHNLGAAAAPEVAVIVRGPDGQGLGAARLSVLPPPDDLVPKVGELTIALAQPAPAVWSVNVDPDGKLDEITRDNNRWDSAGP